MLGSPIGAKFCQLFAILSVICNSSLIRQKKYLKSGFKREKETCKVINKDEKLFASLKFDFFRVHLNFALKIRPLSSE